MLLLLLLLLMSTIAPYKFLAVAVVVSFVVVVVAAAVSMDFFIRRSCHFLCTARPVLFISSSVFLYKYKMRTKKER